MPGAPIQDGNLCQAGNIRYFRTRLKFVGYSYHFVRIADSLHRRPNPAKHKTKYRLGLSKVSLFSLRPSWRLELRGDPTGAGGARANFSPLPPQVPGRLGPRAKSLGPWGKEIFLGCSRIPVPGFLCPAGCSRGFPGCSQAVPG